MTVGFIVGLEVVLNVSRRNGSITFLSSKIVDMAFDYVPLLLAVVYGLIWAAIDHDVKRYVTGVGDGGCVCIMGAYLCTCIPPVCAAS